MTRTNPVVQAILHTMEHPHNVLIPAFRVMDTFQQEAKHTNTKLMPAAQNLDTVYTHT